MPVFERALLLNQFTLKRCYSLGAVLTVVHHDVVKDGNGKLDDTFIL